MNHKLMAQKVCLGLATVGLCLIVGVSVMTYENSIHHLPEELCKLHKQSIAAYGLCLDAPRCMLTVTDVRNVMVDIEKAKKYCEKEDD